MQSRYEWLDDSLLSYQYRRFNKKMINIIPLAYLYPEPNIAKQTSRWAGFFAFLSVALMFMLAHNYFSDPGDWHIWEFISAETGALTAALIFFWYLWHSNREKVIFYYNNGAAALELLNHKNATAFINELKQKSIQATLRQDAKNLELLKKEISQLTREKIISNEFENILFERLMSFASI
jgi:hypothetical protein